MTDDDRLLAIALVTAGLDPIRRWIDGIEDGTPPPSDDELAPFLDGVAEISTLRGPCQVVKELAVIAIATLTDHDRVGSTALSPSEWLQRLALSHLQSGG